MVNMIIYILAGIAAISLVVGGCLLYTSKLKEILFSWQEGMAAHGAWNAVFWCNHDQPRVVSRFGDEGEYWKQSAKILACVIHAMRGTPYIYQGEELRCV